MVKIIIWFYSSFTGLHYHFFRSSPTTDPDILPQNNIISTSVSFETMSSRILLQLDMLDHPMVFVKNGNQFYIGRVEICERVGWRDKHVRCWMDEGQVALCSHCYHSCEASRQNLWGRAGTFTTPDYPTTSTTNCSHTLEYEVGTAQTCTHCTSGSSSLGPAHFSAEPLKKGSHNTLSQLNPKLL